MRQWLTEHIPAVATFGGGAILVLLWRAGVISGLWRGVQTIIRIYRESALRTALQEKTSLQVANAQLKVDLEQELRTNLARGDINSQDRATIRALVAKIDAHNAAHHSLIDDRLCLIDYSELYTEIKKALT